MQPLASSPESAYSVTMSFGELLTTLLVVLLSVLLLMRFFQNTQRQKGRLPPGPPALPIIGNILQLDFKAPHKSLIKLSEQYGPVFTFWFGSFPAVVVCGAEAMREALIDHGFDFSGRYRLPILKIVADGYGVGFSSGERWKQLRRFTLSTLRNFGMGKKSIEERIQEEAQFLVTSFRNKKGEPFNPNFLLRGATSNIICSITFGKRFDYEDKQLLWLMELVAEIARSWSSPWIQLYNAFPRIMDFLPGPHRKVSQNITNLRSFLAKTIQSHKETVQKDSPRDYIDCFLTKMDEEKDELNSEFFHKNLLLTTQDLFIAGTETTSTTLCWALQILTKYPEVQEKIHNEIDDVIGSHRRPAIEDRVKMPYTDAVIHEVQRYIDIAPMSLPHMATSDVNFRGYLIPKGIHVIPVLSSVLKNNSLWESPESFNANHFLDENGCFKKSENFVAFSAGKRTCLGESLARMELFLFLTTLLQNFVFKAAIDRKDIDISPDLSGFVSVPHVYKFYAVPR
ncbi:cytochrome P450 2C19-like isoform X2 [Hemitrygon akajei]|uniref:cytochrome P450 2C19-like isoform X2 n=1 Tax=Hemitrygon akajei TaxID=2704970 RepID=UPI003BF9CDD4